MRYVTGSSELQSALQMKFFPVSGEKLDVVLMCVAPLIVPILGSTEHIRNFVSFGV
jgi:hypothetical protein